MNFEVCLVAFSDVVVLAVHHVVSRALVQLSACDLVTCVLNQSKGTLNVLIHPEVTLCG